jgi:hypothetical protein
MPDTIVKKWNGTAFEELYPKTTHTQIVASGTASSSTFLRGDGQWIAPAFSDLSGSATTAQLPTITVAKGGTGQTSYSNAGGVMYYNSQSGIISAGGAASQNAVLQATGYNGTHYFGNWVTLSTLTSTLEAETTIATLATNTLSSSYSVSGYRFAHIWLSETAARTTTTIWQGRIDLSDTNQRGTTTGNQRYQRIVWNNGTTTFADNLEIYSASASTIQFRHSAGVTLRYRIVWEV